MIVFLYTNQAAEHQAIGCLKSLERKITDDVQIVYYTIGFMSNLTCKNLHKVRIEPKDYPNFCFYKAELTLRTMEMFPDEQYFVYTDADILFSHRLDFEKLKSHDAYPNASYGPHAYPYKYLIRPSGEMIIYDEAPLMQYYNVQHRTCRYVGTGFYTYNRNCTDFIEEWISITNNKYLYKDKMKYLPYDEETAFNICLWKRGATNMLGFNYLNTTNPELIHRVETEKLVETYGDNKDALGALWEYIKDSDDIIFYHGAKDAENINEILKVLGIV
jgi:hypothetical protein